MLEYLREEALRCPGCGLPRDETMDPEAEGHFRSRALKCHACAARDHTAQEFADSRHRPGGYYFTAEPAQNQS